MVGESKASSSIVIMLLISVRESSRSSWPRNWLRACQTSSLSRQCGVIILHRSSSSFWYSRAKPDALSDAFLSVSVSENARIRCRLRIFLQCSYDEDAFCVWGRNVERKDKHEQPLMIILNWVIRIWIHWYIQRDWRTYRKGSRTREVR